MRVSLLLAFLFIVTCMATNPGVKVAIKQKFMLDLKDQIIPIIKGMIGIIRIGDFEFDAGPIHIRVYDIRIRVTNMGGSGIELIPNSNRMNIRIADLGCLGTFGVEWRFGFLHDGFNGDIGLHNVGVSLMMAFGYDEKGKPTAEAVNCGISIDANNVDLQFNGNVWADVANQLAPRFKPIIADTARGNLQSAVPANLNSILNGMLSKMPLVVDIGPNMAIAFRLISPPWVIRDNFCVSIAGYIFAKNKPVPPPYEPKPCPDYEPDSPKTIQFFLTDYVVRSALDAAYNAGLMDIKYTIAVDNYDLTFECEAKSAPILAFNSSISVTANGDCKIVGKNRVTSEQLEFGIAADLISNLNETIANQTLYFKIIHAGVQNMKIINPNNHNLKWFEERINDILDQTANALNILLGQRGIQLPSIPGIIYQTIEEYAKDGYIEALVTPIIKLTYESIFNESK